MKMRFNGTSIEHYAYPASMSEQPDYEVFTYDQVMDYCKSHRGENGFCSCSSACSGPTYSNLVSDETFLARVENNDGLYVLRGGNHGSCRFIVKGE